MRVFLTGATGYLGGYAADRLLRAGARVTALVRAPDDDAARMRIWRALQLHLPANTLADHLAAGRLRLVRGDVCAPRLGLEPRAYEALAAEHEAVVHAAASLNRRSDRACFDVNLRGGLEVLELARRMHDAGGLRRYLHVSTVAVAGKRRGETVGEDQAIEWTRSDWDPYARTKKFGEHLVERLLPGASVVIVRPSIVLGDSRFPETTQFDMVRAFVELARLPLLPFAPRARLDIVPADYVGDAIAALALAPAPRHRVYHLAAGEASPTFEAIGRAVEEGLGRRRPRYAPRLGRLCGAATGLLADAYRLGPLQQGAALLSAFWPYLEWDVVFGNERIVAELGRAPAPFAGYCAGLMRWSLEQRFRYPYRPFPPVLADVAAPADALRAPALAARGCS